MYARWFFIANLLVDEPELGMATSKVDKRDDMAAENQRANDSLGSTNSNEARFAAIHDPTAVTDSNTSSSDHSDLSEANKLDVTSTTTPSQGKHLVQTTYPAPRRRVRVHDKENAHLFNNAGVLIPSIPGIDSATERSFDKGEIMSLGQSRYRDNTSGKPIGG